MKYSARYFFDWGSGVCLWGNDDITKEQFDYPISLKDLPISDELKAHLEYLIEWHDEALNWDDPASELLWTEAEIERFKNSAVEGYKRLQTELEDEFDIILEEKLLI